MSLSARRKQAASQASIPQRPLLVPPSSNSLTKSSRRFSIAPKKGQANYIRASSIVVEKLFKKVDTINKEDTKTNKDNNCGSTTQYPLKESSIVVNSPYKDFSSINFKEIPLPRAQH